MTEHRKAAVAGSFYPADADELRDAVLGYVKEADGSGALPKALIVPHAGYVYSGPIAGSGFGLFKDRICGIKRVVIIGPSHRLYLDGLAMDDAAVYETPLGEVPVDASARESLADLSYVQVLGKAHKYEHGLEVQIPFLQVLLESFSIVPLVVGQSSYEQVAEVLRRLWGGKETLVVISSDLSHYFDYERAAELDQQTSRSIEALNPKEITPEQACGRTAIGGLLLVVKEKGLEVETLDVRNSADTAGSRESVVGYGAYVFR